MKKCKEIQKHIVFEKFGIGPKEKKEIYAHIRICNNCKKYNNSIKELKNILVKYKVEPPEEKLNFLLKERKFKLKFYLIWDSLKYAFGIIFVIILLSLFISHIEYKKCVNTLAYISRLDAKSREVILNLNFYSNNEFFDNLDVIAQMENCYENI